jgi:hypothetical protein
MGIVKKVEIFIDEKSIREGHTKAVEGAAKAAKTVRDYRGLAEYRSVSQIFETLPRQLRKKMISYIRALGEEGYIQTDDYELPFLQYINGDNLGFGDLNESDDWYLGSLQFVRDGDATLKNAYGDSFRNYDKSNHGLLITSLFESWHAVNKALDHMRTGRLPNVYAGLK